MQNLPDQVEWVHSGINIFEIYQFIYQMPYEQVLHVNFDYFYD
jgi:hypothetical protein